MDWVLKLFGPLLTGVNHTALSPRFFHHSVDALTTIFPTRSVWETQNSKGLRIPKLSPSISSPLKLGCPSRAVILNPGYANHLEIL